MLKSTGYFRSIECPFGDRCRRPHCHFKHRGRPSGSESSGGVRIGAEYDPCNPDLPSLDDGLSGGIPEPSLDILELERVNKAIEAVKSEVEREQRKYEKLLGTQKDYSAPLVISTKTVKFSSLEYDPGSYKKSSSTGYNPTPLTQSGKVLCKYTLDDSDEGEKKNRFMEYVPTTVTPVPKCNANKYVIDNSKPHTDMEYDPMSNYSARLLSKAKEQRETKRNRRLSQDDGYTPTVKKFCRVASETLMVARFSDSEEETVSEYCPSASKSPSLFTKEEVSSIVRAPKFADKNTHSREVKEIAVQYDMDDIGKPFRNHSKDSKKKHIKAVELKTAKQKESLKDKCKHTDHKKSNLNKEEIKKSKTNNKTKSDKVEDKLRVHKEGVNKKANIESGRPDKNKVEKKHSEKKMDPVKNVEQKKNDNLAKKSVGDASKNRKSEAKAKSVEVKNGKLKNKETKGDEKSKGRDKSNVKAKIKPKKRSLSHVDLFGDESSEEEMGKKLISNRASLSSDGGGQTDTKKSKKSLRRPSTSSVDSMEIDYSILEKELDSDSDPMEECLRVFNESQDVKTEDKGRMKKQKHKDSDEQYENLSTSLPSHKKRISHATNSTNSDSPTKPVIHPYRRPTPQEICYQRIKRAQEQAVQLLAQETLKLTSTMQKPSSAPSGEKKRIAHLPISLSSIQPLSPGVKKTAPASTPLSIAGTNPVSNGLSSTLKARTLAGMSSKTTTTASQRRQAHVPSLQSASLKRPVIPTEFGAKVPTVVRQRYLNIFIDECSKFCSSQQEAFDKALEEEKIVYGRSSSKNIYLNVAVNTLKKLRSQTTSNLDTPAKNTNKKAVSHESVLGGKLATKTSFSVQRNSGLQEKELSDAALYKKLKEYVMTPEQLQEHGYPFPHPDKPGRAVLLNAEEKKSSDSFCRVCCRCGAEYMVSPSGNCVRREECVYHWGRLRRQRGAGGWETQYSCCSVTVGSTGCQVAKVVIDYFFILMQ
ncbi:RNA exonuclease 1 homolog isoform X2 [Bombina bombina]|uniref:RNA exonuclease 1 homolog isoform X2 n=1 Tax=Bombina bombina TaxID=8345 RepID=UPI00235A6A7C|nr:RNA exonuclease 1 homolog isoform X2 [Bombina bombina]